MFFVCFSRPLQQNLGPKPDVFDVLFKQAELQHYCVNLGMENNLQANTIQLFRKCSYHGGPEVINNWKIPKSDEYWNKYYTLYIDGQPIKTQRLNQSNSSMNNNNSNNISTSNRKAARLGRLIKLDNNTELQQEFETWIANDTNFTDQTEASKVREWFQFGKNNNVLGIYRVCLVFVMFKLQFCVTKLMFVATKFNMIHITVHRLVLITIVCNRNNGFCKDLMHGYEHCLLKKQSQY